MALITMNPDAVREYSLKEDQGEDRTVFKLGVLDAFSWAFIEKTGDWQKATGNAISLLNFIVLFGVRGWSNFRDAEGKELAFETEQIDVPMVGKRDVMKKELLRHFTVPWITELAQEIQATNRLSGEERKN